MNILVIGAGAIGCLVGGKLAQAGQAVTLVGRPHVTAVLCKQGLLITDERGRHQITAISPVDAIAKAFGEGRDAYDVAIMTVKSYDTEQALDEFVQAQGKNTGNYPVVLSLQNGVGNEEAIAARLGSASVIAGTITTPVSVQGPGAVHVDRPNYSIGLSSWHPAVPQALLEVTQTALKQAGFAVLIYPNALGMKWTKLLMNILGNASSAILDLTPQDVFADPMLVNLEIAAWRETLSVMHAAGIPPVNIGSYPFSLFAPLVQTLPNWLLRGTLRAKIGSARGGKMPSLHIDLHNGKGKSEISWLNGAVVKKGEQLHVPTPVNRMLTDILLRLVTEPQQQVVWQHNLLRFIVTAGEYRATHGSSA